MMKNIRMTNIRKFFFFSFLLSIIICCTKTNRTYSNGKEDKDVKIPTLSTKKASAILKDSLELKESVAIQPYGAFPFELIKEAEIGIQKMYKLKIIILSSVELPTNAFYPPRNRYRAEKLLVDLDRRKIKGAFKMIGLTSMDISTTKEKFPDWGIFGLGGLPGESCIISIFRLKTGNASNQLLISRLVKVINHEIGHTLGLEHCPVKNCLMEDAAGTIKTVDSESGNLCPDCAKKVKHYLVLPKN